MYVTAPAGYGKTYVMKERIKFFLKNSEIRLPNKILALTFSNAAANEMKERISFNISNSRQYLDIANFHTFAYYLLRTYGNYIGINRNFTLVNEAEKYNYKINFFDACIKNGKIDNSEKAYDLTTKYNTWYNRNFLQSKKLSIQYDEIFNELRVSYNKKFIDKDNLDFDHLLFKSIELCKKNSTIKNYLFSKYKYILADEFQDTNHIQYLLFKEIASNSDGEKRPVFVVGDKKQSIMKFQGANPENIDLLIKDFNCHELELKKNHRTNSKKIISITNLLRGTSSEEDFDVECKIFINNSVKEENTRIVNVIKELKKNNVKLHNVSLLFPLSKTSNQIKKALDENSIDYIFINDFKFDSIELKYSKIFEEIKEYIKKKYNEQSVYKIVNKLINTYYKDQYENNLVLITLENFSRNFDASKYSSLEVWQRLQEFYNCIQMEIDWTKLIHSKNRDKVFLSTIHSSKGLEFDYVVLFGIVNYRLPYHTKCFKCGDEKYQKKVDISEAEDLFYVGVSRAIKDVIFLYSKQDEQNLEKTTRRISCVFNPLIPYLKFIDFSDNEYQHTDHEISGIICTK